MNVFVGASSQTNELLAILGVNITVRKTLRMTWVARRMRKKRELNVRIKGIFSHRTLFLLSLLSESLCFLAPFYPSLTQTDSGEGAADEILGEWFPSLVDFPVKFPEGTTQQLMKYLLFVKTQVWVPCGLALSHCMSYLKFHLREFLLIHKAYSWESRHDEETKQGITEN